ncbi:3'(2'),5'-bisphosphate nucleotidase [Salibacterium salarium]|uniref:3'(2'),5'-bisphosphate nucleotidase CysQ n=1 Tax=Salibacterium salarium TaxID=284579 RepID=A0A3R9QWZ4_9BACI|nr:3'(2'),5'-bisphosphate nucleotidase CysQ [Salibacterium salarium]RSL35213.1 3'(2'),5'-bisphosphate nucleotidase [Salibacterium salarium]
MLKVIEAALDAGKRIMEIYEKDFDVEYKEDESPLTIADQTANEVITNALHKAFPDTPVLSEEGNQWSYKERSSWDEFFLVDPLDGTKEFIKKNGEFTVNIALVSHGAPCFGVIYAPALDILYIGDTALGAVKVEQALHVEGISDEKGWFKQGVSLPNVTSDNDTANIVASRSHMSEETKTFIQQIEKEYKTVQTLSTGSSLKLCLVAEGAADYYPRYAPTMEWDTGAGQAIVEASGGTVTVAGSDEFLSYNKENLKNPWFLAKR